MRTPCIYGFHLAIYVMLTLFQLTTTHVLKGIHHSHKQQFDNKLINTQDKNAISLHVFTSNSLKVMKQRDRHPDLNGTGTADVTNLSNDDTVATSSRVTTMKPTKSSMSFTTVLSTEPEITTTSTSIQETTLPVATTLQTVTKQQKVTMTTNESQSIPSTGSWHITTQTTHTMTTKGIQSTHEPNAQSTDATGSATWPTTTISTTLKPKSGSEINFVLYIMLAVLAVTLIAIIGVCYYFYRRKKHKKFSINDGFVDTKSDRNGSSSPTRDSVNRIYNFHEMHRNISIEYS